MWVSLLIVQNLGCFFKTYEGPAGLGLDGGVVSSHDDVSPWVSFSPEAATLLQIHSEKNIIQHKLVHTFTHTQYLSFQYVTHSIIFYSISFKNVGCSLLNWFHDPEMCYDPTVWKTLFQIPYYHFTMWTWDLRNLLFTPILRLQWKETGGGGRSRAKFFRWPL